MIKLTQRVADISRMTNGQLKDYLSRLNTEEVVDIINETVASIPCNIDKWKRIRSKQAGRRIRVCLILLEKLGKDFRKKSMAEEKENDFIE